MVTQITATLPTLDFPKEVDYPTQEDWAAFSAAAELNFGILGNGWSTQMQLWKNQANAMSIELNNNADIAQSIANYQGDWTSKGYSLGQSVSVSGVYYICKLTHATGQNPTTINSTYWNLALGNWSLKADKTEVALKVNNYGNETIAGIKTFSSSPKVPTPTTGDQAANKDYADLKVALADFTGSNFALGPNGGYQKLPSGLIIQWGKALSSGTATYNATATLPIAFPIEGFVGVGTIQAAGIPQTYTVQVGAVSKTQIPMTTLQSTAITAGIIVNWVAIGY